MILLQRFSQGSNLRCFLVYILVGLFPSTTQTHTSIAKKGSTRASYRRYNTTPGRSSHHRSTHLMGAPDEITLYKRHAGGRPRPSLTHPYRCRPGNSVPHYPRRNYCIKDIKRHDFQIDPHAHQVLDSIHTQSLGYASCQPFARQHINVGVVIVL